MAILEDLPDNVATTILKRLPAKLCGRLRCLNSRYRRLLSSQLFSAKQLQWKLKFGRRTDFEYVMEVRSGPMETSYITYGEFLNYFSKQAPAKDTHFEESSEQQNGLTTVVEASANGLLLARVMDRDNQSYLLVWNALTRQSWRLPSPTVDSPWKLALGFNGANNKFGALCFSVGCLTSFQRIDSGDSGWSTHAMISPHQPSSNATMIFAEGMIMYLPKVAPEEENVLISYDMESGRFSTLPLPRISQQQIEDMRKLESGLRGMNLEGAHYHPEVRCKLREGGGKAYFFRCSNYLAAEVWILKGAEWVSIGLLPGPVGEAEFFLWDPKKIVLVIPEDNWVHFFLADGGSQSLRMEFKKAGRLISRITFAESLSSW